MAFRPPVLHPTPCANLAPMSAPEPAPPTRKRRRAPAFVPVPTRARKDGWTPHAQARFITALAKTQNVRAAAAHVGLSRTSAYNLRKQPDSHSFCAAWDACLANYGQKCARKLTPKQAWQQATSPLIQPPNLTSRSDIITWKHDTKTLLRLLRRFTHTAQKSRQNPRAKQPRTLNKTSSVTPPLPTAPKPSPPTGDQGA
jgi:transposase